MATYFLLISIIPVIIVGAYSGTLVIDSLRANSEVFAETTIGKTVGELNLALSNTINVADYVATDNVIKEAIKKTPPSSLVEQNSTNLQLNSMLDLIQQQNNGIFSIHIISENGGVYSSSKDDILSKDFREEEWYKNLQSSDSDNNIWLDPHNNSLITKTPDTELISLVKGIFDSDTGNFLGVVMVDIKTASLQNIFDGNYLDEGYSLLLDTNDTPIIYPIDTSTEEKNKLAEIIKTNSTDYLITKQSSKISPYSAVGIVPFDYIFRESEQVVTVVLILTILIGFFTTTIVIKTAKNISEPIIDLSKLMKQATDGDLQVYMEIDSQDEVGDLVDSFNKMISEINKYTSLEIDHLKQLRKSELSALQAQINPHFLYNTLDSIAWAARAGNDKIVVTMVTALTKFFRVSLSKGRDIISIEEELLHIDNYLIIQSLRYQKSILEYIIDVDKEFYRYRTIKLLLQPLVENAIYHGIKLRGTNGQISITADHDEKNIYLYVSDNGPGMDSEKLKELNFACEHCIGENIDSYGVINVCKRMKIMFGQEYTLKFSSVLGEGTVVTVPIPKNWTTEY